MVHLASFIQAMSSAHVYTHDALRRDMWPEPMILRDKLYGNLEELKRTAAFVRATGISLHLAYDEEEEEEAHFHYLKWHIQL